MSVFTKFQFRFDKNALCLYATQIAKAKSAEGFKKVTKMINPKILESAVLLNLVNHKIVAQTFINCASFINTSDFSSISPLLIHS